jgi:hypothetical protein
MDLKIVRHKTFKKIYYNFLVISILIITGGFIFYKTGIQIFPDQLWALSFKNVFLYAIVGMALVFGFYIINNKQKLKKLQSIEEKITLFEKYYTRRLWWHIISCLTTTLFLLLTWHILFFYFGLFDLVSMLGAFPSKEMLKRELAEEDLIFS